MAKQKGTAEAGAVVEMEKPKAVDELVWVYYPVKEKREVNNDGSLGKVILDKDGRYPIMTCFNAQGHDIGLQAPRQVPRSRLAQAKSQGWHEDPNAKHWVYHKSKKPKLIKESELAGYLANGWVTSLEGLNKRYETDDHGNLTKKPPYPEMNTYVEEENE
jgi:hypothetical protein